MTQTPDADELTIRDPLYGYITLAPDEQRVVESRPVQRLRRVQQLGLSALVYPGATHTRFEHSLGVMHLAGRLAESVNLDEESIKAYRLAGLLHDVGHSPFSHATEPLLQRRLGIDHEQQSCRIIDELDEEGLLPVDADHVKNIVLGESPIDIVHGDVDADRMDYLRRDAMNTGVEHGYIDTDTIINFAGLDDGTITYDKKCIHALEGLFAARLRMTHSVYEHHTCKITEAMLARAVEAYLDESDATMGDIAREDDYQLHARLLNASGTARRLYENLVNRNLFKRALFVGQDTLGRERLRELEEVLDHETVREAEADIAAAAGLEEDTVLVDPPVTPARESPSVAVYNGGRTAPFADLSPLPGTLYESKWRATTFGVYAPAQHTEEVSEVATAYFLG